MTGTIREFASAKINLSLAILGRRPDGYHELSSLVVFADVGDALVLAPSASFECAVNGPMAGHIDSQNMIERAASLLTDAAPALRPGRVSLYKTLPVGAGLGGGSSDAAAYLRAVRRANPNVVPDIDWQGIALSLGADVPVCFTNRAAWMHGMGENLFPLDRTPSRLAAVLVNSGTAVSTAKVFQALRASAVSGRPGNGARATLRDGMEELAALSNDLEAPALEIAPEIATVRAALEELPNVRLVRMSGSGATFFGLFDDTLSAQTAASQCRAQHPDWWIESVTLGDAAESQPISCPG